MCRVIDKDMYLIHFILISNNIRIQNLSLLQIYLSLFSKFAMSYCYCYYFYTLSISSMIYRKEYETNKTRSLCEDWFLY